MDTIPIDNEAEELRELIRVQIDIYGLTMEDIEFLRSQAERIHAERQAG